MSIQKSKLNLKLWLEISLLEHLIRFIVKKIGLTEVINKKNN